MQLLKHKLVLGGLSLLVVVLTGSIGYYLLALFHYKYPHWAFGDCMYMTFITLTTVGFGEIIDLPSVPGSRFFTVVILMSGLGISAYFVSTLTAFLVEGELKNVFWRKRMDKLIRRMEGHTILCGAGRVGANVLAELLKADRRVVVIELREAVLTALQKQHGDFAAVVGDASHAEFLREAGIERAAGIITTLSDDKDNLCVVVTCKELNPRLRMVSSCGDKEFASKLELLGAEVVIPNFIGSLRIASQMIRPRVVRYLDTMLRGQDCVYRIEEVAVPATSSLVGQTLLGLGLNEFGNLLILAVIPPDSQTPMYNPPRTYTIRAGDTLVFQAEQEATRAFEKKFDL